MPDPTIMTNRRAMRDAWRMLGGTDDDMPWGDTGPMVEPLPSQPKSCPPWCYLHTWDRPTLEPSNDD